jgi:hypothetical protein
MALRKAGNYYQNLQGPVTIGAPTGGFETPGSINAQALFVNGVAVSGGAAVASVTGTANQVAASPTTGAVVVSLPQNVIIPTPASGVALTVTGVAGSSAAQFLATGVQVGSPTGGDQGVGTINATGLFVNGGPVYSGIPQNLQNTNYTFVLSDANKHIFQNAGGTHTYTIPANASVAFPIGTAITIVQGVGGSALTLAITSDTLNWLPSGVTGTRTLGGAGSSATILKVAATVWYLTGVGIT